MRQHPLLRDHDPGDWSWHSWTTGELARALPFLDDHRFQGSVIFPGSAFVELALSMARIATGTMPRLLRDIRFEHPLLVGGDSGRLFEMQLRPVDGGLEFAAASRPAAFADGDRRRHASMTLPLQHAEGRPAAEASLSALISRCREECSAARLYAELNEAGNHYGPAFRRVRQLWLGESEAIARLNMPAGAVPELAFPPALLDAAIQVLAATQRGTGAPFLQAGCDEIHFHRAPAPDGWVHAEARSCAGNILSGNIRLLDDAGRPAIEMRGLRLHYFATRQATPAAPPERQIVLAASFTAEPLEETLRFWLKELDLCAGIAFAPFDQLFQQLLDPTSLLSRNRDGLNVLLVRLEDWLGRRDAAPPEDIARLRQLNRYETEDLYREIFIERSYLRHGIVLGDGDCVVDIGANIGLFTLFVHRQCPHARIFAFEPAPPAFAALAANTASLGHNVRIFKLGLADTPGIRPMTIYRHSSVFSGFRPDPAADGAAIAAIIRARLATGTALARDTRDRLADELLGARLQAEAVDCAVTTLSAVMAECGIDQIDLLKIDAEKSEGDILSGIAAEDWPKIRQIVVEVHDGERQADEIRSLLRDHGFAVATDQMAALRGSGLCHIYATREALAQSEAAASAAGHDALTQTVDEFVAALAASRARGGAAQLVIVCPPSPAVLRDPTLADALRVAESKLTHDLGQTGELLVVGSAEIAATCAVQAVHAPLAERLGHLPYMPEFFAALGTVIARQLHRLWRPPWKVIVVDCDETLWSGACGEVGPSGVTVDPAKRQVQTFLAARQRAGKLLCLCSRNEERDVLDVFAAHPDMPLRLDHVAARRINWLPKSENIRALADELGLGLESFIFLDDDPVERAEVEAHCPEVLTLRLPAAAAEVPAYLARTWAIDDGAATAEDRRRHIAHAEERRRQTLRQKTPTFAAFIASLGLEVAIVPPAPADLSRLAQLTFRTNQFNCTTIRRSEAELRRRLASGELEGLVVDVSDRFGAYGRVGAMLTSAQGDRLEVDTLLLSCRALGRGVEHRMLAWLGHLAVGRGLALVAVPFVPSGRNGPALAFLEGVGADLRSDHDGMMLFRFPADRAAAIRFNPQAMGEAPQPACTSPASVPASPGLAPGFYDRIATEFSDAATVLAHVRAQARRDRTSPPAAVQPADPLENRISAIWRDILGLGAVGIDDNFFEVGGSSLRAVELISRLAHEVGIELTIVSLFERPTIRTLAAALRAGRDDGAWSTRRKSAEQRAAWRRRRRARSRTRGDE